MNFDVRKKRGRHLSNCKHIYFTNTKLFTPDIGKHHHHRNGLPFHANNDAMLINVFKQAEIYSHVYMSVHSKPHK